MTRRSPTCRSTGPPSHRIVQDLAADGVSTGIYYPIPVHRQPYVVERGIAADLPETDRAAATTLSIPIFPGLAESDQDIVIAAVRDAVATAMRSR